MIRCYIGIGSNVGDRAAFCRRAVTELDGTRGIRVEAVSSLYETAPVGGPPQRSFVNLVCRIETVLPPREILAACKRIEEKLGRKPSDIPWGPRLVDLDVLLYGDEKISEPDFEVPHPLMSRRGFVLVPLLEIDPGVTDPWGQPYADRLEESEGEVEPLEPY
jgi:2-amino-4-hydroxy-6-hydroxymethyldihydropteridine diphosphokinase